MLQQRKRLKADLSSGWWWRVRQPRIRYVSGSNSAVPGKPRSGGSGRINNTFRRADRDPVGIRYWNPTIRSYVDYFPPIVADAEAGFGGVSKRRTR
ncbi:hypothetical protein KCP70_13140 [Salmonella enterica subsp. enterica]|nr:hypothetical protein KCP70_13140 [Salmonella enterica subsp. enterica]